MTLSATYPYYATDGTIGVSVAQCQSQDKAKCATDGGVCATKAGDSKFVSRDLKYMYTEFETDVFYTSAHTLTVPFTPSNLGAAGVPFVQYLACATPTPRHSILDGIAAVETASCIADPLAIVPTSGAGGTGQSLPMCICSGSYAAAPWDSATNMW